MIKKLCIGGICLGIAIAGMALAVSAAVKDVTRDRIYTLDTPDADAPYDCILVLGCRVYEDGRMSHMLQDRVDVGITLYQKGVGKTLLMSGDSHSEGYDEVGVMRAAAIAAGVPEDCIMTDAWGLSTYDSVARIAEDYRGKRILIVTQGYHLHRALYIADKFGLDADGVSADLRSYSGQWKRELREIPARCKDVFYSLKRPTPAGTDLEEV